jgi:hypothetical protein
MIATWKSQKGGERWRFRNRRKANIGGISFTWNGEQLRGRTKQTNKRVAEQMEAAHRTVPAKGEVGMREKKPVPTLKDFAETDFPPVVRTTFTPKEKTQKYYGYGVKSQHSFEKLTTALLDAITTETSELSSRSGKMPAFKSAASTANCRPWGECSTWSPRP